MPRAAHCHFYAYSLLTIVFPLSTELTNSGSSLSGLPSPHMSMSPLATASAMMLLSRHPPVVPITARDWMRRVPVNMRSSEQGSV